MTFATNATNLNTKRYPATAENAPMYRAPVVAAHVSNTPTERLAHNAPKIARFAVKDKFAKVEIRVFQFPNEGVDIHDPCWLPLKHSAFTPCESAQCPGPGTYYLVPEDKLREMEAALEFKRGAERAHDVLMGRGRCHSSPQSKKKEEESISPGPPQKDDEREYQNKESRFDRIKKRLKERGREMYRG